MENNKIMKKLKHKVQISGIIEVLTGMHIGGAEVELDIGGIDDEVVKIKEGEDRVPYIPGSSLKGKLRALLGRYYSYDKPENDKGVVAQLFGRAPKGKPYTNNYKPMILSQLMVRDCYAIGKIETEDKAENTINRVTGEANPRHLERVTKGAKFQLDMMMDIYEGDSENDLLNTLKLGFEILKKDYLGGNGTRGYGKIDIYELKKNTIEFNKNGTVTEYDQVDL